MVLCIIILMGMVYTALFVRKTIKTVKLVKIVKDEMKKLDEEVETEDIPEAKEIIED